MRKPIIVAASLLFVGASSFAQQPNRSNAVSVFVSDVSVVGSRSEGTKFDAAYGAALDHMFNDRLSGEISVTSQRFREDVSTFSVAGAPVFSTRSSTVYPLDANVTYHFFTDSRWKPYFGGGLRYVSQTFHGTGALGSDRFTSRTADPEVSGGITFQFRPNLGLRFDAKQIVGGSGSFIGDPAFKGSVGLSLRF